MEWSPGGAVLLTLTTVLGTALASRLVLIPLRLRTGTIVAPFLLHFAANAIGLVAGVNRLSDHTWLITIQITNFSGWRILLLAWTRH